VGAAVLVPVLLCFYLAATAGAAVTHPFLRSFGPFSDIQGLAVDQTSGDLYVLDVGSSTISRFNPEGDPVPFVATGSYISGNELTGTPGGAFGFAGEAEEQLAVAPAGAPAGTAGDLYVAEAGAEAVAIFASSGEYLGRIDGSGNTNPESGGEVCGVATDPSGDLYIASYNGHVDKYVPSANPPLNSDFDSEITGVGNICNIAASGSALYASIWPSGPLTAYPLTSFPGGGGEAPVSGGTVIESGGSPVTATTAAADFSDGTVYVDEDEQVGQFNPDGSLQGRFGSGQLSESHGLSVDASGTASDGNVYVADGPTGEVQVYGPAEVLPTVTTSAASGLGGQTATLNGIVDPEGVELTSCRFEYGTTESYAASVPCAETAGEIGDGEGPVTVHAEIDGLAVGTNYHYRLTAENLSGRVQGEDELLITLGPQINEEHAGSVTSGGATLEADVNPAGDATTYEFQYVSQAGFQEGGWANATDIPAGGQAIGSGNSPVPVTQAIDGLAPLTSYHFRVLATNSTGTAEGSNLLFVTYAAVAPPGRAFELVSPADAGGDVNLEAAVGAEATLQASPTGASFAFPSFTAFPQASSGEVKHQYVSTRGLTGWSTTEASAPLAPWRAGTTGRLYALSSDLGQAVVATNAPLDPDARVPFCGFRGLYREDVAARTFTLIDEPSESGLECPSGEGASPPSPQFYAATPSTDAVVFSGVGELLPGAGGAESVYEWFDGALRLVSVVGGRPVQAVGGPDRSPFEFADLGDNVVSRDGSRVYFSRIGECPSCLYLREWGTNEEGTTYPVSASERTGADPTLATPNAQFLDASEDGAVVFFTSPEKLTENATADGEEHRDLYRWERYAPEGERLTDLTIQDPEGAGIPFEPTETAGDVAASEDGSHLYFMATGALASGAKAGEDNIYLWTAEAGSARGRIRYVATLPAGDSGVWSFKRNGHAHAERYRAARIGAGGRRLLFASSAELDQSFRTNGFREIYLYDEDTETISCVSCSTLTNPSTAESSLDPLPNTTNGNTSSPAVLPGNLSADGSTAFFQTAERLVPEDTNGKVDVYEWREGRLSLVSDGEAPADSSFLGASADGSDVFFATSARLVPGAVNGDVAVYDARVGGGFPESPGPVPCSDEACKGPPVLGPSPASASTSSFQGAGNPKREHHKKPTHHKKRKHDKTHKRKAKKKGEGKSKKRRRGGVRSKSPMRSHRHG
jgi:hypothetical protein